MPDQNPVRELLDLVAVHRFYVSLVHAKLRHEVPVPSEAAHPDESPDRIGHSIDTMRRWLALLDLAIQPVALRDTLKTTIPPETLHALIRYVIEKPSHTDTDRDKADFVLTSFFRSAHPDFTQLPDSHDRYLRIMKLAEKCEQEIGRILGDVTIPPLKEEHRQLLHEFEFLHQEVADFRTFDQLMDSGIVQRVRDIKHSFQDSFYHPVVLSNVAVYNAIFGKRFDDLFHATTEQIRTFAEQVQHQGGSIMSKVEGDITLKNLADVHDEEVMNAEYGQAQEQFRQISRFKKAVDKRGGPKPAPLAAAAAAPRGRPATSPSRPSGIERLSDPALDTNEENKIRVQMAAISSFVRVTEKSSPVVPLVKGVVNITPAESDCFRVDYGVEKSFRADYAFIIRYIVAIMARLVVEKEEMRAKHDSAYLWKPHADSIAYILQSSATTFQNADQVMEVAKNRGLDDKVTALKATVARLQTALQEAAALLKSVGVKN